MKKRGRHLQGAQGVDYTKSVTSEGAQPVRPLEVEAGAFLQRRQGHYLRRTEKGYQRGSQASLQKREEESARDCIRRSIGFQGQDHESRDVLERRGAQGVATKGRLWPAANKEGMIQNIAIICIRVLKLEDDAWHQNTSSNRIKLCSNGLLGK
ncbi:hypothetical protein GOP47_0021829, partial [Adiantum capillus-veneris]